MFRSREHGYIHADFRDSSDSGKGLDTRHRHNKVSCGRYFSAAERTNDSRLALHSSRMSMWERMMRSFSACSAHISPSTVARTSSLVEFMPLVRKTDTSVIGSSGFSKMRVIIAGVALPKTSVKTSSSFMLETVRQFWAQFFSPEVNLVSFQR